MQYNLTINRERLKGYIVSIIEAGVFIIAGCLATMRVLLLIGLPSKLHSQQKVSLKEWTPNSVGEEDGFPTKVSYGQA
jgi:hypothetical protein